MKKSILTAALAVFMVLPAAGFAKGKNYIYRSRANWVKLIKLSNKQLAGVTLQHPVEEIAAPQMEAMLLSLTMSKASLFKKEINTNEIFSIEEARKYAPYVVQALKQAGPNQVVNVSVVHERPYWVIQKDFLSMINVYKDEEGVHFNFSKLFAKLTSDYEQASKLDKAINDAKTLRVGLEAQPGQKLAYSSSEEAILDPNFDFVNNVTRTVVAQEKYHVNTAPTQGAAALQTGSASERLKALEELKAQKLISESEYNKKRKEILKGL